MIGICRAFGHSMRVAIYSRFSTDRQNESSIADQVRVCVEYAQRQGWTVLEQYEDLGISGAALGNRPGVLRLQEAAFAQRLDVILVTDLSRLSRSQGDLSKLIDRLVARSVRVVGVQDGYDSARRGHKLHLATDGRAVGGDELAAHKARLFLRELLGRIDLKPEGDGELWAEYGITATALLKVVGFSGSGGRI
jgi:hypothetical protein